METQKGHGEGHGRKGFKSYYVVWKLLDHAEGLTGEGSLNRTM